MTFIIFTASHAVNTPAASVEPRRLAPQRKSTMNPDTFASDLLGYAAAALVLLTFVARSMHTLRTVAIASNVMFIAYALLADLPPVLLLHALLLPLNAWRLWQSARAVASRRPDRTEPSFTVAAPPLATFRAGSPPRGPAMPLARR
jgi:hypothetical protein